MQNFVHDGIIVIFQWAKLFGCDNFYEILGVDDHLVEKILNPDYLNAESSTFRGLQSLLKSRNTSARAWVGEAGGAYNSGRNHVTNSFIFSFWFVCSVYMH